MKKTNYAKKVWRDGFENNVYPALLEKAAGDKEANTLNEKIVDKVLAGIKPDEFVEFEKMLYRFGWARGENGFNAGYELGFQEGVMLAVNRRS